MRLRDKLSLFTPIFCSPVFLRRAAFPFTSDPFFSKQKLSTIRRLGFPPERTPQNYGRSLPFSPAPTDGWSFPDTYKCKTRTINFHEDPEGDDAPKAQGRIRRVQRETRIAKVEDKGAKATLTLPSPLQGEEKREPHSRFFAASRDALLLNWCWCVHPMRAGAAGCQRYGDPCHRPVGWEGS
jgi:hypothetical protein